MKKITLNWILGASVALLGASYVKNLAYRKEVSGYMKGCEVILEAMEKNSSNEEKEGS